MSLSYLSVCSGIEAATVAWHPLGWKPWGFSEIEKFPCALLKHHYPDVPNYGDMTKFEEWPDAKISFLVGGTPCQSFSVAGLRKGLSDPRGNLMLTFGGIARRYRPRWLVWENVPGVLSSNGGRDFGTFLGMLAELGYGFAYRVLDAQYFGVAQRRRRVFVVGYFGDWRPAAAVLFERDSLQGNPAPRRETGKEVAGTFKAGSGSGGWSNSIDHAAAGYMQVQSFTAGSIAEYKEGIGTLRANGGDLGGGSETLIASTGNVSHCLNAGGMGRQDYESETLITHSLRGEGFDASEDGTGRGTPLVPCAIPINTQIAMRHNALGDSTGFGIGETGDPMFTLQEAHSHAVAIPIQDKATRYKGGGELRNDDGSANGFGAGKDGDPAPTLGANDVHAVAFHPTQDPICNTDGTTHALSCGSSGGQESCAVATSMAVRRLTPIECERLQGFPDDYTAIPHRGKPAADGPRYKALGNSMAVPVMRWIGRRISDVDAIMVAA